MGFALSNRLASVYDSGEAVAAGGLMSYGADRADSYRRIASYIDKIQKGAKPADLPVMSRIDDAEEHGFVASLARPGRNVTGMSIQTGELSPEWLRLLKEAVPGVSRVAILWDETGTVNQLRTLERSPHASGLALHVLKVRSSDDFTGEFLAATTTRMQGLVILGSPLLTENAARLAELAAKHRLPAIYNNTRFVQAGGLMSYGVKESDPNWGWRRAAVFVDKVLKGATAADIPVERPYKFELVINLITAKQIGLTIPPNVLARADRAVR